MTTTATARVTRISFLTDTTRVGAPVIPIGYMLEALWEDAGAPVARWLGLIGRGRYTPLELDRINLTTWPEFKNPRQLITRLIDCGWNAPAGDAGAALLGLFGRSAMDVAISERSALVEGKPVDTESEWSVARALLLAELDSYEPKLLPTLSAMIIPVKPRLMPGNTIDRQIMTQVAEAA